MPTTGITRSTSEVDGRRLRRAHNRDAVLDALLCLFREGNLEPSSTEIAARSGLSPRSLYRYFDDIDDLRLAAAARQISRAAPLVMVDIAPGVPTTTKVERLVNARARLFEEVAPAARAMRVCAYRHPVLAEELDRGRRFLRHQIDELFPSPPSTEAARAAVDVLCSFESYELLRVAQGRPQRATVEVLVASLTTLLDETAEHARASSR